MLMILVRRNVWPFGVVVPMGGCAAKFRPLHLGPFGLEPASRAGHRPATLPLGPMSIRIAFSVLRIAETQPQRRSLKPDLPIEHLQSQEPCALDGFWHPPRSNRHSARHLSRPQLPAG